MRRLIINADDYGLTPGVNLAIRQAHQAGVVTSATLMAGGSAFHEAAADSTRLPRLGVGCHVVLVDGTPLCDPLTVPSLLDVNSADRRRFPHGLGAIAARALSGKLAEAEIVAEATAQIHALQSAGIAVDHVDTHKHTHMFPQILKPLLRAAKQCGVGAVRNPFVPPLTLAAAPLLPYAGRPELWKRFAQTRLLRVMAATFRREVAAAGMATTDGSFGIVATGALDLQLFCAIIRTLPQGTWEFVCHPGYDDAELAQVRTRLRESRAVEFAVLTSTEARTALDDSGVELITFGDLARG